MRALKCMALLCSLYFFSNPRAQEPGDELDPLMGSYILGNSAELTIHYAPTSGDLGRGILDYASDPAAIAEVFSRPITDSLANIAGNKCVDVAIGDLNGDRYDEIIAAWECPNHSIALSIPAMAKGSLGWTGDNITVIDSVLQSGIRVFTGDFDRDRQKEFVLAYHGLDGHVHIELYQTDSLLALEKLAEIADFPLGSHTLFDLAAGDFDYDGLDEIVLMQFVGSDNYSNDNYRLRFLVKVYDYNHQNRQFVSHATNQVSVTHFCQAPIGEASAFVPRLAVATGNFDGDGRKEVVYGYEVNFCYSWDITPASAVYYTHFYSCVSNFKIGLSLDSVTYDENRKGEIGYWYKEVVQSNRDTAYYTNGFSISVDCNDLNGDGIDEVVGLGSFYLSVFTMDENLSFTRAAQIRANGKYGFAQGRRLVAVVDLDADTTAAQEGRWAPEIVHMDVINNPQDYITNPGAVRIRAHQPVLNSSGAITGLSYKAGLTTAISGNSLASFVMAPGDFDGDAVRLGRPRLFTKKSVVQPTVILNAPPVHFDIINDTAYDVCYSYNENDPEFVSSYAYTTSSDKQVETEIHGDWGVSASLSAGGSFLGVGAKTTLTTKYGEGFSRSALNRHSMVIEQQAFARMDDEIFGTITDYSLWEYPVYFKGEHHGYVLAAIPYFKGNNWFPSKSWTGISHVPNHEVGNILSYPNYANITHNPDLEQLLYQFNTCELHGTSQNHMVLTFTEFTSMTDQTSWDFGMSINSSVEGWGVSLETEAHYNRGEINTHTTSVSEQFEITIDLFDVNSGIGEVNYKVSPYAYRSKDGAIVIDYNVEAPLAAPGDPVTWWQRHYGAQPDPAFILPWLYDPEKGYTLEEDAKRHLTKEITLYPENPQAGDTVTIRARIHNYSLIDTDSPISVRFYEGDPDNDGTALVGINGETEATTPAAIASQGVGYVEMDLLFPAGITGHTRIYALIDPDGNLTEIHKNNNKGFFTVSSWDPTPVRKAPFRGMSAQFALYQNCPNPFNRITTIAYEVKSTTEVTLTIYNSRGRCIKTLVNGRQVPGLYSVSWDGKNNFNQSVSSGVYFYMLKTGTGLFKVNRMLLK